MRIGVVASAVVHAEWSFMTICERDDLVMYSASYNLSVVFKVFMCWLVSPVSFRLVFG